MDKEIIQQIAAGVVHRLPFGDRPWLFLLVTLVVTALGGAIGALGASYFRTRGQNLATKHDFDELKRQLEANTKLVENIKSEVSQRDWAQREWTNLRRVKLETLVEKMHECEVYLEQRRHTAMEGKVASPARDPVDEIYGLTLYFRELEKEIGRFAILCRQQSMLALELAPAISATHSSLDAAAHKVALENFQGKWTKGYPELLAARRQLMDAARPLLERMMNVVLPSER